MVIPSSLTAACTLGVWILTAAFGLGLWGYARHRRRSATGPLVVVTTIALVTTVYLANSRRLVHLDSQPQVWAAVSLVTRGDFTLDEFRPAIDPLLVQCITSPSSHWFSMYPPGSVLAAAPVYAAARWLGLPLSHELLDAAAKLAAALWTAASAALLWAALRRYAPDGACLATVAYAFGTTAWSSAAQDLWQHGPSQAGLAAALFLLASPGRAPRQELALGATLGWAVLCRTSNLLPALILYAAGGAKGWPARLRIAAGAAPFALFTLAYNRATTGSPFLFAHSVHHGGHGFGYPLAEGLAALLFEPSRGLFVYSPFLLLALAGVFIEARRLRSAPPPAEANKAPEKVPLALVGAVAALPLLLLVAQWEEWHGGWSYGFRIISEVSLLLSPAFAVAVAAWRGRRLVMAAANGLVVLSVAIHGLHVFFPENRWNATHLRGTAYHGRWSLNPGDWQIAWHLRAAFGPPPPPAGQASPANPDVAP